MPVIAIVNQKGGTGKTSLATNLGSALAQEQTVLLLDADAQGSSQDWAESRAVPLLNLQVRAADPGRLAQDARGFSREFNWVLIDGPAGISRVTADAVRAADAVLIPATPSPYDVWAASTIVEAVKARQQATGRTTPGRVRHHQGQAAHPAEPADRGRPGGVRPAGAGGPDYGEGRIPPHGHRRPVGAGRAGPGGQGRDPGPAR